MNERIIEEFKGCGLGYFVATVWTTAIKRDDLIVARKALFNNGIRDIDLCLVNTMTKTVDLLGWSVGYKEDGQPVSSQTIKKVPVVGPCLKITFAFKNKEDSEQNGFIVDQTVNFLRILLGAPAARTLMHRQHFSIENPATQTLSEIGYASNLDCQNLNLFSDPPIYETALELPTKDAAALLSAAFNQTYPQDQFIFFWLALESILRGKSSNRKKVTRENYFKKELSSDAANEEVFRLFNVRNEIFKEGKFDRARIGEDVWSLYMAIQLLLMKPCQQRDLFVRGYERYIQERNQGKAWQAQSG